MPECYEQQERKIVSKTKLTDSGTGTEASSIDLTVQIDEEWLRKAQAQLLGKMCAQSLKLVKLPIPPTLHS